jgi:hypothetical protein
MLGNTQVLRVPNTQIECTSFQRLCTGLNKRRGLGMLGLFRFTWMISFLVALSHTLVSRFQEMVESEFQMSMMGELTFFLGIQVKQTK